MVIPSIHIIFIAVVCQNTAISCHPSLFNAIKQCSINIFGICKDFKMQYVFWPICNFLYQIIFGFTADYLSSLFSAIFCTIYFIIIWIFQPDLQISETIIQKEPFALSILNLILFIKRDNIPNWIGYFFIGLAFLPVVVCVIYYLMKEKGHDFEAEIFDMQKHCNFDH